jgi:hypothetical protein
MLWSSVSAPLDKGLILDVRHQVLANVEFRDINGVGREFVILGLPIPAHDAAHLELAGRDEDELEGGRLADGKELRGGWGWLLLGGLGLDETGVLAGIVLLEFGEELGEEEVVVAVGDELVGHIVEAVARAEAVDDGAEGGMVVAKAAEVLGGEGG